MNMACLKLEVDDVDEQMFGLDSAVTVKTEQPEDKKDLSAKNEVDPGSNFNNDYGYGDVITIAPLGDVLMKEESVGPNIACNETMETISVNAPDQDASCQMNSAHDTDIQPVEPVGATPSVHQMSADTSNSSSSTEAEALKEASHSQPSTSYRGTTSSGSSPVTDSSVTIPMQQEQALDCESHEKQFRRSTDPEQDKTDETHYRCEICGKTFKYQCKLRRHLLSHTGERPHKCPVCGKAFAVKESLTRHSLAHTGERPFKCKVCGKGVTTSFNLKQHSLTHTVEKTHKCRVCGNDFATENHLRRHSLTHTGEEPFKCKICGKTYKTFSDLKQHSETHTGEIPHKCYICGDAFRRLGSLKLHLLTHTGEKPHKCHICGKGFARQDTLKRHSFTHTGEKPHECEICGKAFAELGALRRHSERLHFQEKSPGHRSLEGTPVTLYFLNIST